MKKASEYRQHADECRVLAGSMPDGEQRDQLMEMARTWDQLASERSQLFPDILSLPLKANKPRKLAAQKPSDSPDRTRPR